MQRNSVLLLLGVHVVSVSWPRTGVLPRGAQRYWEVAFQGCAGHPDTPQARLETHLPADTHTPQHSRPAIPGWDLVGVYSVGLGRDAGGG